MTGKPLPRWLGVCLLLLIASSFASNHVAARFAFDHGVNVITAVAVRSVVAALFVLGLMRTAGITVRAPRLTRWRAVGVGLLVAVQSACLYSAVARIPVALALLVFNTFPILLGLISWAAGSARPSRRAFVAMATALFGLALALDAFGLAGNARISGAGDFRAMSIGVAFALAGSLSFAGALYLTTRWLSDVDGRLRSFMLMTAVAVVAVAVGLLFGRFQWPVDRTGWVALTLLTIFYGTAITALFVVLPRMGAVNNAAIMNFEPIAALLLGWVLLGQQVAPIQLAGAAVVIGAIVLVTTAAR